MAIIPAGVVLDWTRAPQPQPSIRDGLASDLIRKPVDSRMNAQKSHKPIRFVAFQQVHPRGADASLETLMFSHVFGLPEAKANALRNDATLRELMQLWTTLDHSVQQAIVIKPDGATIVVEGENVTTPSELR